MPLPRNRRPKSSAQRCPIAKPRASTTSVPQTDSAESPQPDFDLSPSTLIPQLTTKRDLSIETANATSLGRDNLAWYACGRAWTYCIPNTASYQH
ncbi:hypothetical protein BOTBODRAFT_31553 [Botryobasidium botryosum FD-172 SS1]|uniref:Uncharacterized protein n=1 Tax=Botryobasidium botryosum (strain FD-172 SS1) TaxID=930990 RepID=A0A067MJC7_BOTB1|nr:hypothetical protein BOTBODRAFT_31553 [Botryobasidium botryosum FD-172 SS1]